jgi:DNA gyrase subunit A
LEVNLTPIIKDSFIQYSGAVLQSRALVDSRDLLKPSARQIFYSMWRNKYVHEKPYEKTNAPMGDAMKDFYIHGDSSCVGIMMRAAQNFSMRYPITEVKGNSGTLMSSGSWSAERYTSTRLAETCNYLFADIQKNTIEEWHDNYADNLQYPSVLPSKGFYNLVNGSSGIAVGMASSVPQFNIRELNEVLIKLLWEPNTPAEDIVILPDFATGAIILNPKETKESLLNGRGFACKLRSLIEYNQKERCFIVSEVPFGVYTNTICEQLEKILESEENPGIERFNDLTGNSGYKSNLKIYLTKHATPEKVLKYLYKNTSLQSHYTINMTMLENGRYPKVFTWKELLQSHLDHERLVYRRGFEFDLNKIRARLHIIEGLLKAIDTIDEVIHTIKASASTAAASVALQKLLSIDEIQAKAILDIKLSRLAHLEVNKLVDEKAKLESEKARIEAILADETLLKKEIENGLRAVATKFGDTRRTRILDLSSDNEGEIIEEKSLIVNLTNYGNIYAHEQSTLITQRRGGTGSKIKLQNGECVIESVVDTNLGTLMAFSDGGRGYSYPMSELPIDSFVNVSEIFKLTQNEKISNIMSYSNADYKYVIFITEQGMIKKTELKEYKTKGARGSQAIRLRDGDSICRILFMNEEDIGLLSANGQFIRFATSDIAPVGKIAMGVAGAKLNPGDKIIDARALCSEAKEIVSLTSDGMISRTPLDDMPKTNRNVKGTRIQKVNDGETLVGFVAMSESGDIIATTGLTAIKFNTREVSLTGRGALGVKALKLKAKEKATGIMGV